MSPASVSHSYTNTTSLPVVTSLCLTQLHQHHIPTCCHQPLSHTATPTPHPYLLSPASVSHSYTNTTSLPVVTSPCLTQLHQHHIPTCCHQPLSHTATPTPHPYLLSPASVSHSYTNTTSLPVVTSLCLTQLHQHNIPTSLCLTQLHQHNIPTCCHQPLSPPGQVARRWMSRVCGCASSGAVQRTGHSRRGWCLWACCPQGCADSDTVPSWPAETTETGHKNRMTKGHRITKSDKIPQNNQWLTKCHRMTKGESATEWQSDKVSQIAKQWQSATEWQNAAKWQSAAEWQNDSDAYTACFQRLGRTRG